MARVKRAITIIKKAIANMQFTEDYGEISGMIIMANLLNHITDEERAELKAMLDNKCEEL